MKGLICIIAWIGICLSVVAGQEDAKVVPTTTTTLSPAEVCSRSNVSCGDCVAHASCLWCESSPGSKCIPYPTGAAFPTSVCNLSDAKWGVCWVNYQILLIVMFVLAFVVIVSAFLCIYCCCCRIRGAYRIRREQRETQSENRAREEREARNAERRAERQAKYDEIRIKYGLKKDDSNVQYNRFQNDVC